MQQQQHWEDDPIAEGHVGWRLEPVLILLCPTLALRVAVAIFLLLLFLLRQLQTMLILLLHYQDEHRRRP